MCFGRIVVEPVQVFTIGIHAPVSPRYPVGVDHGHQFEHEVIAQHAPVLPGVHDLLHEPQECMLPGDFTWMHACGDNALFLPFKQMWLVCMRIRNEILIPTCLPLHTTDCHNLYIPIFYCFTHTRLVEIHIFTLCLFLV